MTREMDILLVEDNPGDARIIREMLAGSNQERIAVKWVSTLQDALAENNQHVYDVILLDLSLPDSHGIDTLLKMEAEQLTAALVVLTGINDENLGIEAVQMGAQDYLPKDDVDSRLLLRSIRYAIERHHTEVALRRSEREYRSLIDDVFDTSMVAVLILDGGFRVVWCNEATEVYFGIKREYILGRDKRLLIDEELKCIFADPNDYAARLLEAYEIGTFTDRFECQVLSAVHRDERWLEHWSQPIREGIYSGGRIEQYTDITDRKKLEIAERQQREFVEALHDINTVLTSSLDRDEVLGRILKNLDKVVPHDSASIAIVEEDHFQIAQFHSDSNTRDTQEIIAERRLQMDYMPYANVMYQTLKPIVISNLQEDPLIQNAAISAKIRGYIGAPIQLQDKVIGFLNLFSERVNFFTDDHIERLSAFSRLAAIAIQNARLYDQSRQLATLEERQRLARDLHDSVTQTIFTCRTMSESALRRWTKDPGRAYELMQDVNQLAKTALAEMRILLLELRPTALTEVGLKQLFEQYLEPIQDRREFTLNLGIDEVAFLPPDVQIAFYRITQEALNNIDKHAQATQVDVRVRNEMNRIVLEIQDDGRGFNVMEVAHTSLGLSIMRERAEEIGAHIDIKSAFGEGTRIQVDWKRG